MSEQFSNGFGIAKAQLGERFDVPRHNAISARNTVLVHHQVHPITLSGGQGQGKIQISTGFKAFPLLLGQERRGEPPGKFARKHCGHQILHFTVATDKGTGSRSEVKIARAAL